MRLLLAVIMVLALFLGGFWLGGFVESSSTGNSEEEPECLKLGNQIVCVSSRYTISLDSSIKYVSSNDSRSRVRRKDNYLFKNGETMTVDTVPILSGDIKEIEDVLVGEGHRKIKESGRLKYFAGNGASLLIYEGNEYVAAISLSGTEKPVFIRVD